MQEDGVARNGAHKTARRTGHERALLGIDTPANMSNRTDVRAHALLAQRPKWVESSAAHHREGSHMERPNAWKDYTSEQLDELHYLCEGYKAFISDNKTERECCAASVATT